MERVHPHGLRHTLASDLLRAGTPLAQIAPILRHASVATTAIYAKIDREALERSRAHGRLREVRHELAA